MATEWTKGAVIITTNLQIGKVLAAKLDPDTGGAQSFDPNGWRLRPVGSQTTTPTAWSVSTRLRQRSYDAIAEFMGPGPYTLLNSLGITNDDIALGKPVLSFEIGEAEAVCGSYAAILTANGYERIPTAQ